MALQLRLPAFYLLITLACNGSSPVLKLKRVNVDRHSAVLLKLVHPTTPSTFTMGLFRQHWLRSFAR